MSHLLDTHALLWALFEPSRLGAKATKVLLDSSATISVSVVSFWEISLKYGIGKLELTGVTPDDFPEITRRAGFEVLPLHEVEAASFHRLPRVDHKDPFDRLIAWVAISQGLKLITKDASLASYKQHGLKTLW